MSKRFTLSGFWLSGPTYKVGLMLSLCGEDFAYHSVNLRAGEHKSPAFLAKNRFGQVPALEDAKSGMALCQSAAILEYLAAELGKFGGEGACGAAQAREWMFWDFDRLAAPIYRLRAQRAGFRTFTQPIVEMYFAEAGAALKVLEEALGKTAWLCGSHRASPISTSMASSPMRRRPASTLPPIRDFRLDQADGGPAGLHRHQ